MAERKKRRLSESCSSSSTEPMDVSSELFYSSEAPGSRSPAPSNVSMRSDRSIEAVPDFAGETAPSSQVKGSRSPALSNLSMRSDRSKEAVPDFAGETAPSSLVKGSRSSALSNVSMRSDRSIEAVPDFAGETAPSQPKQCSVCKEALKARESCQSSSTSDEFCPKCQKTTPETHGEELDLKLKKKLQKEMQKKFSVTAEDNGDPKISLKSIYTTLYVTKGESLSDEHEFRRLKSTLKTQSSEDSSVNITEMFKSLADQGKPHRTVLTKGVAGIGKSFAVQKFIVDWAEEEANQHIYFVFCLAFRELNLVRKEKSLNELLSDFHPALQSLKDPPDYTKAKIVIILDGLDESRLKLNFRNDKIVLSLTEVTSVDNLLVNLIQGSLLPEANIWITSRPAAASQIPAEYIDLVTEIRGFTNDQKVEYFQRKFGNNSILTKSITSHIQSSQCLDIMCQIPIFCWLCSVLFSEVFGGDEKAEIPQTLTETMARFVFVQTKRRSRKYDKKSKTHMEKLLQTHKEFLLKLGRLAFFQLLDNNLIFYEEDLRDNGIDTEEASIYSGFCNTVLREEKVFYQRKIFLFVHLTLQEFFAALYVYECFTTKKTQELVEFLKLEDKDYALADLIKMTVDKVLEKKNGHLDFFIRFLLGLMIEPNRRPLQGLLTSVDPNEDADKKVSTYLRSLRRKNLSPDSCINIFQALVEMRDHKLKDEIQEYLQLDNRSKKELTPLHCSALAYMLQVSKNELEELDLKTYNTTDEGRRRLIPAVRSSKKAVLKDCKVTAEWIKHLVFGLKFPFSPLRDLDLSNNDLMDSGVKLLCGGLSSPCCKLKVLRLSGCCITWTGCEYLVSALKSNPSHLVELDLSYNHLGETGIKLISEQFKQQKLNYKNDGSNRIQPGFKKYACTLTLDSKTAHKNLLLSDGNRKVTWVEKEQPYPDHKERFEHFAQVLCEQGLQERCYFEVDVVEPCTVGLAYKSINRKGNTVDCRFGMNEKSWSQSCSEHDCYIWHKNNGTFVSSLRCSRVGVYLDYEAGSISFYKVSNDSRSHLHTYKDLRFSEALYPAVELHPHSSAYFVS